MKEEKGKSHNKLKSQRRKSVSSDKFAKWNCRVIDSQSKQSVFDQIKLALQNGASKNVDFRLGFNNVCKALEINSSSALIITKDSSQLGIHDYLLDSAQIRRIPKVIIPSTNETLANIFGIHNLSCISLQKRSSQPQSREEEMKNAYLDGIQESITELMNKFSANEIESEN